MDSLHCYLVFTDDCKFRVDLEVSLNTFQAVISDLKCNYSVITHDYEDYKYFYILKGYQCIYVGSCSSWLLFD